MRSHLTVSYELIAFLKWVLANRKEVLSDLIYEAVEDGLLEEIADLAHYTNTDTSSDELYDVVNDFVGTLEHMLVKELQQSPYSTTTGITDTSLDTLADVNLQNFDSSEILQSAHQTDRSMLSSPAAQKDDQLKRHMLLKNLLTNWAPLENEEVN